MTLDHIAIWTADLERLRDYYVTYFDGISNDKYRNPTTGFESYFITFAGGSRIELMYRADIPDNLNDVIGKQHKGIIHLAFGVENKEKVDQMAMLLQTNGYQILKGPRTSGDHYYEFETLDPDNNRLEVITKNLD